VGNSPGIILAAKNHDQKYKYDDTQPDDEAGGLSPRSAKMTPICAEQELPRPIKVSR